MKVWQGSYRPNGGQVFMFPMVAVFAHDLDEARVIAGPDRDNQQAYCDLCLDSAEALNRLGIWGSPSLEAIMVRGD